MNSHDSIPSREDVLNSFAVEPDYGRTTLERYLREFPQYSEDLIDLSLQLDRDLPVSTAPLSPEDQSFIVELSQRYLNHKPLAAGDPFSLLAADRQRSIAKELNVPRQILVAFKERQRHAAARAAGLGGTPISALKQKLAAARQHCTRQELRQG